MTIKCSHEKHRVDDPKAQNAIIRDTNSKVMLIEGIAGSGKTSATSATYRIHRFITIGNGWMLENVLLFSPNHLFSDYISTVLPSLGESGVPTQTFKKLFTAIGSLNLS